MGKKEIFYILLTAVLFSTMEVTLKIAGNDLDSFQLTFIRFAIGGLFLLPFALKEMKQRQVKLSFGDLFYLLWLGVLCICISMLFFQLAIMRANANLIAVLICTNPIFTMIFAHFIVDDHFTKRKAVVLLVSVLGIFIAANPFHLGEGNTPIGILFGIIAAVTFGLYSAAGKLRIHQIGDLAQTSLSFLFGSVAMLIILLFMNKPVVAGITSHNILIVLYIGIAVTGIGYYYYFKAIHACGPSNASLVFFLKPIFSSVVAFFALGEPITWNILLGIGFILLGSYINLGGGKNKKRLE